MRSERWHDSPEWGQPGRLEQLWNDTVTLALGRCRAHLVQLPPSRQLDYRSRIGGVTIRSKHSLSFRALMCAWARARGIAEAEPSRGHTARDHDHLRTCMAVLRAASP